MAKKIALRQPWTKDNIQTLKTLARKKTKTSVVARQLKRTLGAVYQQASKLGISIGEAPRKRAA